MRSIVSRVCRSGSTPPHAMAVVILWLPLAVFLTWRLQTRALCFVHPVLAEIYPFAYRAESVLLGCLLLLLVWAIETRAWQSLTRRPLSLRFAAAAAATYWLLLPLAWEGKPWRAIAVFLLSKLGLLIWLWRQHPPRPRRVRLWGWELVAVGILLLAHLACDRLLTPLEWSDPITTYAYGETYFGGLSSHPFRVLYPAAKRLDFSGFDTAWWGATPVSPTSGKSLLLPLLAWLLDLPAVDIVSYHRLERFIFFTWALLASIGFYLFVRRGLRLSFAAAIFGGLGVVFGNVFLAWMVRNSMSLFTGVFFTLPFCLWLVRTAWSRKSRARALGAGLVFALSFYIYPGHPDTIILGGALLLGYSLALAIGQPPRWPRVYLPGLLVVGMLLGSCQYLLPFADAIARRELHIFGHAPSISGYSVWVYGLFYYARPLLGAFLGFAISAFILPTDLLRRKRLVTDYRFFLGTSVLLALIVFLDRDGRLAHFFLVDHPLPGFRSNNRSGCLLPLTLLVLSVIAIHHSRVILTRWRRLTVVWAIAIVTLALLVIPDLQTVTMPPTSIDAFEGIRLPWLGSLWLTMFMSLMVCGVGSALITFAVYSALDYAGRKSSRATPWLRLAVATGAVLGIGLVVGNLRYFESVDPASVPGNPEGFPPYISLQTMGTIFERLGFVDSASQEFLQDRWCRFEKDLEADHFEDKSRFESGFHAFLEKEGLKSLCGSAPLDIARLTEGLAGLADVFYLEYHRSWYPRQYLAVDQEHAYLANYNNVSMLGRLPKDVWRVALATPDDRQYGVGEGFLIHNPYAMTVDPRFMATYPPIHALYLMPGAYFDSPGDYGVVYPLEIAPERLTEPRARRLFAIGGIDAYLTFGGAIPSLTKIPGLEPLQAPPMPRPLVPPFVLVRDLTSYGLAYFARSVQYVSPRLSPLLNLRFPLSSETERRQFRNTVDKLTDQLLALPGQHSIVLEAEPPSDGEISRQLASDRDRLTVEKALGNRVVLRTHCESQACRMVLNYAALSGWRAFVEETPLPLQRANFAFLSAEIPTGDHWVWFEYRPPTEFWGALLTLLAYLAWLATGVRSSAIHP